MQLLTKADRKALPALYSTENLPSEQKQAVVKFFDPTSQWTWYAIEFDGPDRFFGLVHGHETELGYFSLSELLSIKVRLGLKIERDRWFEPTLITELFKKHTGYEQLSQN